MISFCKSVGNHPSYVNATMKRCVFSTYINESSDVLLVTFIISQQNTIALKLIKIIQKQH